MSGLVFGIMSAIHSAQAVRQLCETLAPHQVVIHHDFKQQPEFAVELANVCFVPNPRQTGWNNFGFTEGLFHLLEYCVEQTSMQYFQLLTPTCLPIKPISAFETYLEDNPAIAHCDGIDLLDDRQALINFGYRTFVPDHSLAMRALFKASEVYFGKDCNEQMQAGLSVRKGAGNGLPNQLIGLVNNLAAKGLFSRHPFSRDFRPHMGSTWFGTRREAAQWLLTQFRKDPRVDFFRKISFADELLVSTLLHNSPFKIGPAHHQILAFNHARPLTLTPKDLATVMSSEKFFARKFADDAADQARQQVIAHLNASEPVLSALVEETGRTQPLVSAGR